jgi:hypothetical protein
VPIKQMTISRFILLPSIVPLKSRAISGPAFSLGSII